MASQKNLLGYRVHDETEGNSQHHQAGMSNTVPALHSSIVAHDTSSKFTDRVYVTTTGPTALGEADGFQGQVYLISEGNLACTRAEDKKQWRVHRQRNPNRHLILTDDQGFNKHVPLESIYMSKAFSIHRALEFYLNGHFSLYRHARTQDALEFTVTLIQGEVDAILADTPESLVVIRCDVPFYDSVDPERRVVVEHVVVEYFRFSRLAHWKNRVRSALVQKLLPWFKSVTGEEDEVFPDDPLPNGYAAQSFDAFTSSLVTDQMPAAIVYPPALDDSMDIDPQTLSTAERSADTASLQGNAAAYLFRFPHLPDKLSCMHFGLYAVCC